VPLPSAGMIYSTESALYGKDSVKIKAMTAKEEDILSSQALVKEGTVVEYLLQSCVLDKNFETSELTLGDRNAIMIAIRITGYGPDYPVQVTCENCGAKNRVNVNLTEIPIKRLSLQPTEPGKNLFEFELPITKKKVMFKFNTVKSENERRHKDKSYKKIFDSHIENNVTSNLESTIVQVDNITDKNKIRHFILNMPAFDSKSLRKFVRNNEPGMDMNCTYQCSSCSQKGKFYIPITPEFFWPST
jgi:hypothetical protein